MSSHREDHDYSEVLSGNNVDKLYDEINELVLESFSQQDIAVISSKIITLANTNNIVIKHKIIRLMSLILPNYPKITQYIHLLFRSFLQEQETQYQAISCLSQVVTSDLYENLADKIEELSKSPNSGIRKLCLLIKYRLYQRDKSAINILLSSNFSAIFDPELRFLAVSIYCELANEHKIDLLLVLQALAVDLTSFDLHLFSKTCELFAKIGSGELVDSVATFLVTCIRNEKYLIGTLPIVRRLSPTHQYAIEFTNRMTDIIQKSKSLEYQIFYAKIIIQISQNYIPPKNVLTSWLTSKDIVARSYGALFMRTVDQTLFSSIESAIRESIYRCNYDFPALALKCAPTKDGFLPKLIMAVYRFGTQRSTRLAEKAICNLPQESIQDMLTELRQFESLPENGFGSASATLIGSCSDNVDDLLLIVPVCIGSQTPEIAAAELCAAHTFVLRIRPKPNDLIKNRVGALCASNSRDVRQLSAQFLEVYNLASS